MIDALIERLRRALSEEITDGQGRSRRRSQEAKDAATYTCDGTADQEQINTATSEVKAGAPGGKVILAAGLYKTSGPILNRTHVTIEGEDRHSTLIEAQSAWAVGGGAGTLGGIFEPETTGTLYNSRLGSMTISVKDYKTGGAAIAVDGVHWDIGVAPPTGYTPDNENHLYDLVIQGMGGRPIHLDGESGGGGQNRVVVVRNVRCFDAGEPILASSNG